MNKFGIVLGIAAVATLAGCKDPDYPRGGNTSSNSEVKNIDTTPTPPPPVTIDVKPATPKCMCLPGTKHTEPCKCGDPNCKCIVVPKQVVTVDVSKPAEPEYTIYTVQNGDYLAKISKKFNVTISSIKRLNPPIKDNNVVRVGQKIKLPGKIDVAAVAAAAPAAAKPVAKKPVSSAPYAGATKEYVVKNGDTLGSIAYGNGINIRQLKALNGLTSDSLKIGQKLKIPAEKVVKSATPAKAAAQKPAVAEKKAPAAEKKAPAAEKKTSAAEKKDAGVESGESDESAETEAAAPAAESEKPADESAPAAATDGDAAKAPAKADAKPATMTYVVAEGEDMTAVCIRWNVTAAEIRELNNLAEGAQLTAGQIIKLPAEAQQ